MDDFKQKFETMFCNPTAQAERYTSESFRNFLRTYLEHLSRAPLAESMFKFMVEKLTMCDCLDPRLVADVIKWNCIRNWMPASTFIGSIINNYILPQSHLLNLFDYGKLLISLRVMSDMDWPFFKLLVRYGVVRTLTKPSIEEINCLDLNNDRILSTFLRSVLNGTSDNDANDWLFRTLSYKCYVGLSDEEQVKLRQRRQTIAYVLRVLNCDSDVQDVAARILAHYFEVVPDPFVAVSEIRRLVDYQELLATISSRLPDMMVDHLRPALFLNESRTRQKFERYAELFPAVTDLLQPRTLRHLSRCAVRSSLSDEALCLLSTLPCLVSKLRLPSELKDYILVA